MNEIYNIKSFNWQNEMFHFVNKVYAKEWTEQKEQAIVSKEAPNEVNVKTTNESSFCPLALIILIVLLFFTINSKR